MPVRIKSSEVQQNFGRVLDRAMMEDDVIVERYGEPRVAILSYKRYQTLLRLEQEQGQPYLMPPDRSREAQALGEERAALVRQSLQDSLDASLDEVMGSLRGREWLS